MIERERKSKAGNTSHVMTVCGVIGTKKEASCAWVKCIKKKGPNEVRKETSDLGKAFSVKKKTCLESKDKNLLDKDYE